MKVKSFCFVNDYDSDHEINRFIKDKEVIDIKITSSSYGMDNKNIHTTILIMYK